MNKALLGKKIGMTRIWQEGKAVPVTVIKTGPCTVLQVKTVESDGYEALQLGFDDRMTAQQHERVQNWYGKRKEKSVRRLHWKGVTQPEVGHLKKSGAVPKHFVREVPYPDGKKVDVGQDVTLEIFEGVKWVDVVGTSKGCGFSGNIRRHGFQRGPASHGCKCIRMPGSIGQHTFPGHVNKGKRMHGQYGNVRRTVRNLKLVEVDRNLGILLVRGGVPGPNGGYVIVRKALRN